MASRRKTVKQLAKEANIDADEALLALWEVGFDDIISPNDSFGRREVNRARRAIGIATRRELSSLNYWISLLKLDEKKLKDLLYILNVQIPEKARKLRGKAISRLMSEARKRGIDPITGTVTPTVIQDKKGKLPTLKWRTPGHKRDLYWLNEDQVREIHLELVQDFLSSPDPIIPAGVQSESMLASAVFRPHTALGEILKYPTVETSAAALLCGITHDHPFHNGNKRTALVSTLVFLDKNGFFPEFDENQAFQLVMKLAMHQIVNFQQKDLADREVLAVAEWFCERCRPVEKGDRAISFRKLRSILASYGCEFEFTPGKKVSITRNKKEKRIFRSSIRRFHTKVHYSDEGRDLPISKIQKIRKDLCLNDLHGIDSHAFYDKDPMMATDFIARYRKTLNRLARF